MMTTTIAEVCYACVVGLHQECYDPGLTVEDGYLVCCCSANETGEAIETVWANEVGRPVKEPSEIESPEAVKNTGRKRAQQMYPIFEMECEWAWLKFAGGGPRPIIGCAGHMIEPVKKGPTAGHRHHGPNKSVLENSPGTAGGNVHRICASCHVRWHALNNEFYGERPPADQPYLPLPEHESKPHDPETRATDEEREENETWWSKRKTERVLDED